MDDDIFARPPRRSIPLPPRQTCAVCGLRSESIVCAMCIEHTASSIVWLEKLPALSMKEQQALDMLRGMARWPVAPAAPLNEMELQVARYQDRRTAATMADGSRPYGWWKRYHARLGIPEMTHADIVRDAARVAKLMDSDPDD